MSDDLHGRVPDGGKKDRNEPQPSRQEGAFSVSGNESVRSSFDEDPDGRVAARNREVERLRAGYLSSLARKEDRRTAWRFSGQ
jgi:hypothetical protein